MTATDLQSMHRLGSPDVSADGRWAVFTLSDTDWTKNKRANTLYLLDLTRPGATPQKIAAAAKGHDAVFGPGGELWFLMPVGEQDQLFRMAIGRAPVQVSNLRATSAASDSPRGETESSSGPTATCAAPTSIAPAYRPRAATGSGRTYDQMFIRHWDTWAEPGVKSRLFGFAVEQGRLAGKGVPLTGAWSATRRPSRSEAGRRSLSRPTAMPSFSPCARPAGSSLCRPTSTFSGRRATAAARRSI